MQRLRNEDLSPTAAGPEWYNEWKWVGVEGEHGGGYEEEEGAFWFLKFKLNFVHVPRVILHQSFFLCRSFACQG